MTIASSAATVDAADDSAAMSRAGWLAVQIIAVVAALAPFVVPAIPVGTDTIKQLSVARILASYHDPFLHYSEHFEVVWRPTATALANLTLAGLLQVFEPIVAVKAFFVIFAVGFWLSGQFYLQSLGARRHTAILLLPLIHSFYVFSGFLPFVGAFALYPLLLGVLFKFTPGRAKSAALALILVAQFGFHVVGAAIGCFTVFVCALNFQRKSIVWPDLLSVMPAAALLLYFYLSKPAETAKALYHGPLGQLKAYVAYNVNTLSPPAGWLAILLLAALALIALHDTIRRKVAHPRLLALAIVFVCIGLLMPYQIGSIFILGSRTLPFAVIATVGALEWTTTRFRWAATASCLMLAASAVLNTRAALDFQEPYRVFLSGMNVVRPGSRLLPIVGERPEFGTGYVGAFSGIEDLYTIYRGGSNPYVFSEPFVPTGGSLLRLKYAPAFALKYVDGPRDYTGSAAVYDYILCWACLDADRRVVEKEARLLFENGSLSIYAGSRMPMARDK